MSGTLRSSTIDLGNGRVLNSGDEFTVRGTAADGRYSFRYSWNGDTEVTCWGPVGSQQASWHTFRPSHITTIHRTRKAHP